jgi:hypothetical protein
MAAIGTPKLPATPAAVRAAAEKLFKTVVFVGYAASAELSLPPGFDDAWAATREGAFQLIQARPRDAPSGRLRLR